MKLNLAWFSSLVACLACSGDPEAMPQTARDAPLVAEIVPSREGHAFETSQLDVRGRLDPATVVLVRGQVSDSALASLASGHVTATLSSRAVPLELVATAAGWAVLPRVALTREPHTLAVGSPRFRSSFDVISGPPLARALLSTPSAVVVCLPSVSRGLEPEGAAPGALQPGIFGVPDAACVTLARPLPSALRDADGEIVALVAPSPAETMHAARGAPCAIPLLAIAGACVSVEDDRLVVVDAPLPSLVLLDIDGARTREPLLALPATARGLRPSTKLALGVTLFTADGGATHADVTLMTASARARPVLMEALADPVGPEPDGEWVELLNDGTLPLDLTGYNLRDAAGASALASVVLAPNETALLVTQGFVPTEPHPPKGCRLIRLPSLGKNGLSNDGEPVELVAPGGAVVSRLPGQKARPGQSLARRSPDVPDDDGGGFAIGTPTPCAKPN